MPSLSEYNKQMVDFVNRLFSVLDSLGLTALLILAAVIGIVIRQFLFLIGQKWVGTLHITLAYMLLPAITLVVTELIAGDIALSLGMVGALSIVRFRNPVKSPLELVMYFLLITIGIALSTRPAYAVILAGFVCLLLLVVFRTKQFFAAKGKTIFALSFEENSAHHIIEFTSKKPIEELESSENLLSIQHLRSEGEFVYKLAFDYRNQALETLQNNRNKKDVSSFHIRLS
jgi:hypothetical protein